MRLYSKRIALSLITVLLMFLAACGSAGGEDDVSEVTTLIYANLTDGGADSGGVDRAAVDQFNRTHTDVKIEVRNYFDEDSSSGKDRLFTEIAAGKVPDIIDLGNDLTFSTRLPYRTLVQKGLLENLWPYIENDPDLGREGIVEAPLKAAEVDGGLYAIFNRVSINTLIGAESVVGDRNSWTLEDLQEAFAAMPENSTILQFFFTRYDMFYYMFQMSIDSYVDWETGECTFTGEKFKAALEFINSFPDNTDTLYTDYEEMNIEATDRRIHGRQMLSTCDLSYPYEIQALDAYYGLDGHAAFIGYPTEDGTAGSSFQIHGARLALSSTCKNKEAAWEFLRQLLLPQYKNTTLLEQNTLSGFPVNRADYDLLKKLDMEIGRKATTVSYSYGPLIKIQKATMEEFQRYEDFINHVDKIDLYDGEIYGIVLELAGAYFAGDKTLDETVDLIQRRVTLYVNEAR